MPKLKNVHVVGACSLTNTASNFNGVMKTRSNEKDLHLDRATLWTLGRKECNNVGTDHSD